MQFHKDSMLSMLLLFKSILLTPKFTRPMKDHVTLRINYPNNIEIMFTLAPNKNIAFHFKALNYC